MAVYYGEGWGHVKFYPYEKGVKVEKVLAILKGGGEGTKRFGVVFKRYLEVLAILKGGGHVNFPLFKKGGGGAQTVFTLY